MQSAIEASKEKVLVSNLSYKSRAGSNDTGERKTNQDAYLVLQNIQKVNNFNIFGAFDGHGPHGHFVSNAVKAFFTEFFSEYPELYVTEKDPLNLESIYRLLTLNDYQIIKLAFFKAEQDLINNNFDCNFSGTTCVLVFQLGRKLICANAGDSRAILFDEERIIELSNDHKANLPEEYKRIKAAGGRVMPYIIDNEEVGPHRVWLKDEEYPGLAMSRSIGDLVAGSVGVTAEPGI